jgi:hypothetical protein
MKKKRQGKAKRYSAAVSSNLTSPAVVLSDHRLVALLKRLDRALVAPGLAAVGSSPATVNRWRYIIAMRDVADFLFDLGLPQLGAHFATLAAALNDLENGIVDPLLQPQEIGSGSRPRSSSEWTKKALVATVVTWLIRSGLKRDAAAEYVVKHYPDVKKLVVSTRTSKPKTAVLSWYDEFREGTGKLNAQGFAVYQSMVSRAAELAEAQTDKANFYRVKAHELLGQLKAS